jgi:hypothetical protein
MSGCPIFTLSEVICMFESPYVYLMFRIKIMLVINTHASWSPIFLSLLKD